jgi:hypothetical protein
MVVTRFGAFIVTAPKTEPSSTSRFLKKAAQKLSCIRARGVGSQKPQTQIIKSFLLLFYKKAGLASLKF